MKQELRNRRPVAFVFEPVLDAIIGIYTGRNTEENDYDIYGSKLSLPGDQNTTPQNSEAATRPDERVADLKHR